MKRNFGTLEAGKSLRHLREMAHLSLEATAAAAQVSSSYLSNVENGKKTASPEWIAHVSASISRQVSGTTNTQLPHQAKGAA